ncbi:UNVERIFIED_CONTAM: hypothetical protein Sradi_5786000 [Sesamum radiatum]|uniref:DNA-directed RNA polymerase III subunit RPC4 n=1 Tax=Sesamum radiatum TaxID=300843 RepID=A0AAW2KQY6_SESRA
MDGNFNVSKWRDHVIFREKVENDLEEAKAEQLLRRLNEASLKGKPKVERKAGPTQVAFGYGGSSNSLRFGLHSLNIYRPAGGADQRVEKEYKEPWDYYTYYPTTLPLRRPYSGNPELRDEEEFAEDPQSSTYDEPAANSALELGLLDENMEETIFFLQLPSILPTIKQSTNAEVPEADKNANPGKGAEASQKPCKLEDLPAGLMGKMLVYRSGAIKLKLGDTLYDVSAGLNCVFGQDVVAINPEDKHCCNMGEINKRAIITPDTDSMLDAIADL